MDATFIPIDLLTPLAAAKLLGVSPATIRRWTALGRLPAFKLGGRLRVSRVDVLAMLTRVQPEHGPMIETKAECAARDAETDRVLREAKIRR